MPQSPPPLAPHAAMPAIADRWQSGVRQEIAFWRMLLLPEPNCPPAWRAELLARCDPAREADPAMMAAITTAPPERALILDLAAGPVSCFGWRHRGVPLNLVPIDALAEDYAALVAEAGLTVPVPTRPGHAEALAELFAPGTVDLVHMRNGLDHCYDPARVIEAALQVLKPGGWLRVSGYLREGEKARYEGLHQWNLDLQDGRAIIWRPGQVIDPARQWPGAQVEAEAASGWISLRMRRLA